MPTLVPGWKVVPRWRTMMLPAGTTWPPKRFTPRRWPGESRPLRELPPAFLCAMALLLLGLRGLGLCLRLGLGLAFGGGRLGLLRLLRLGLGLDLGGLLRGLLAVGQDLGDAEDREVLAVAVLAAVVVPALLLEDQHLVALALGDDGGADAGAAYERGADGDLVAVAEHQDLAELDDLAGSAGQALDLDHVVGGDPVLLAAGADDCEHFTEAEQCAKGMRGR